MGLFVKKIQTAPRGGFTRVVVAVVPPVPLLRWIGVQPALMFGNDPVFLIAPPPSCISGSARLTRQTLSGGLAAHLPLAENEDT
jgi:hypothetical protein